MKTQIIRLEPHDDLISARDKMTWGQTGRILLVWPEGGKLLNRRLDLTLLQRHSSRMGAQLALVCTDSDVRFNAHQLGIPVYRSLRQAQNSHWRLPRRLRRSQRSILPSRHEPESGWQRSSRLREASPRPVERPLAPPMRLAVFSLGVLAVMSLAALLLPTAELHLPMQTRPQSISLTLQADPTVQEFNLAGAVPARAQQVIVEGRRELPVTGRVLIADRRAEGEVVFTNLTEEAVQVPAGSIIRSQTYSSPQARFSTTAPVTVPAGPGETAAASVQAVLPGSGGNLPALQLDSIEGLVGAQVSVHNPEATRGGRDRQTQSPSPEDRAALHAELLSALQITALEELKGRLAEDDLLLTGSLELAETLEEIYEPAADIPGDYLSLHLRLEFEARVVSGADVKQLSAAVLDANLPSGFAAGPAELQITYLSAPSRSQEDSAWQVRVYAARSLQAQLDARQAVDLALGLSPEQAAQRLAHSLPLQGPPQIELLPAWWPRLPVLPFRIQIQTGDSPDAGTSSLTASDGRFSR
jgi:hypothetical protein